MNGKPMSLKVGTSKKLGTMYEQKQPAKPARTNGGILVRAKRTWMGEEGHVFRGQEIYVTPTRHTFLSQQGWVETIEVPDAARREAPFLEDAKEEAAILPDFLSTEAEEKITPNAARKVVAPPTRTAREKQKAGKDAPIAQKSSTIDKSRPVHAGTPPGPNTCKKCQRSFSGKESLAKHLEKDHPGGK